jgi:ABC-type glycerol-3-phosphate transport system substrate-binding protein
MNNKIIKLLLPTIAALAAVAGSAAFAAETIKLNVWSDGPRLEMFESYDQKNDHVELNITTVAPPDLVAKIQLAMQSGTEVPDVVFLSDINYTAQLSTRRANYVLDLTDLIPQELRDEFYKNSNTPCELDGKLLCLRNDMAHFVTWYNAKLMADLGEDVPTTWEEFAALGSRIGPKGMALGSGVEPFPMMNFLAAGGCNFASPVAGQEGVLRIDLSTKACTRPARMMDELLANGALTRVGPFDPAFISMYKEGRIPLLLGPTWFGEYVIKAAYEAADGETAAALPPRWSDQNAPVTWSWGGGTYAGWKDTKYVDEVVDLITWMATDVGNQENAVTLPADQPSALAWGKAVAADPFYADDQTFAVQVDAAKFSDPNYVSLRIDLSSAFASTIAKAASIGDSVEAALPALEAELSNQAKLNGYTVVK